MRAAVLTHRRPEETTAALAALLAAAREANVELVFDAEEAAKHAIEPGPGTVVSPDRDVDICIVLGGDGTILRALQLYARTETPVIAVNFGEIGFLATVERSDMRRGFQRAFAGDYELLKLPALLVDLDHEQHVAINDLAIHRKVGERVAVISYSLDGEVAGSVRCDGLVLSTPAGSTGYNLANGGPVMAWGVEGYVVSFIAPHSLNARALVVAPADPIELTNGSADPLDVVVDGRLVGELASGASLQARFADAVATLAQPQGSSFYRRLREKFGRLAS
ncbi:MAG TPA: NAD(+)/NADH kinase [Solirubrobacteraceae bacterium]|nr:NAD(+)/NADH kinase [Solirubrobacteraceae bacterium]